MRSDGQALAGSAMREAPEEAITARQCALSDTPAMRRVSVGQAKSETPCAETAMCLSGSNMNTSLKQENYLWSEQQRALTTQHGGEFWDSPEFEVVS